MPATIDIHDDRLVIDITGRDKLWALKSHLEIPMENVTGVRPGEEEARRWLQDVHVGGAHIRKHMSAGTFYWWGDWNFWDVHHPDKTIGIELRDHHYRKLVIEVADPDSVIDLIDGAITARAHQGSETPDTAFATSPSR